MAENGAHCECQSVINIEGISFSYGKRAILENLTFEVPRVGLTWISGPNGIGKTTLLRVLGGMLKSTVAINPPSASLVYWDAECLTFDYLTVEEMLDFMATLHHQARNHANHEEMILPEMRAQRINALSLGQRTRLVFTLAENTPCDVLLLDEPFNGLDYEAREQAAALLARVSQVRHVVFSAHEEGPWSNLGARELRLSSAHELRFVGQ